MPTARDISIFFNIKCCNKDKQTNTSRHRSVLVEPMPNFIAQLEGKQLQYHEVCITIRPKIYNKYNNCEIYHQYNRYNDNFWKKYKKHTKCQKQLDIMVPEFNKQGIIHFHKIMYFNNSNDYWIAEYKQMMNKKLGLTKGKKVFNLKNYGEYMLKDQSKTNTSIIQYKCNIKGYDEEESATLL